VPQKEEIDSLPPSQGKSMLKITFFSDDLILLILHGNKKRFIARQMADKVLFKKSSVRNDSSF
jgi:hypothetical protein